MHNIYVCIEVRFESTDISFIHIKKREFLATGWFDKKKKTK